MGKRNATHPMEMKREYMCCLRDEELNQLVVQLLVCLVLHDILAPVRHAWVAKSIRQIDILTG